MGAGHSRWASGSNLSPLGIDSKPSFTYLTLTTHPLNDLHPLSLNAPQQGSSYMLISTQDTLLYTSHQFPFVIMQNSGQS